MRKAEPDDQRFTEFTDHWIRRDINLKERDHRQNYQVEPLNKGKVFAAMGRFEDGRLRIVRR